MARRQQALLAGNYPYLVAERSGWSRVTPMPSDFHTRPAYRWSIEDSIYVDPKFHGQGIGRLLITRLLADAEARGFRQMIAVIGDRQMPRRSRCTPLRFPLVGTLRSVGFKHGRWLDTVVMQRPLGSGDRRRRESP